LPIRTHFGKELGGELEILFGELGGKVELDLILENAESEDLWVQATEADIFGVLGQVFRQTF
jgi:hypothetical protein